MDSTLYLLFFLISFIHTSVGFGGGSSYSALLATLNFSNIIIKSNSLICNLFATIINLYNHYKNNNIYLKDALRYTLPALPMVYIGSSIKTNNSIYLILLGTVLILSVIIQHFQSFKVKSNALTTNLFSGIIGLISGFVGIGGGVLLAPILLGNEDKRKTTFITSFYIFCNSLMGIAGYLGHSKAVFESFTFYLILWSVSGALAGNFFSFRFLSPKLLKTLITILLTIVGFILVYKGIYTLG